MKTLRSAVKPLLSALLLLASGAYVQCATPEQLHQSALQNFSYKPDSVNVRSLKIPFAAQQRATRGMTAYFISVGQGDSEYIELPNGKNVLIDGGPNSAGVSAFLKSKNVSTIDYLVLTHPHADHFSGLAYVFDNLQVNNFYDTMLENRNTSSTEENAAARTSTMERLYGREYTDALRGGVQTIREKAAAEPNCHVSFPDKGQMLDWDANVQVRVLNGCPLPSATSRESEANNCSIVLHMTYNGHSFLFTGDAEKSVLTNIVQEFGPEIQAEVLKVPHHGSQYAMTKEFIDTVQPKVAYIEVGPNTYGFPTKQAMGLLQDAGVKVFRTDRDGTQYYHVD